MGAAVAYAVASDAMWSRESVEAHLPVVHAERGDRHRVHLCQHGVRRRRPLRTTSAWSVVARWPRYRPKHLSIVDLYVLSGDEQVLRADARQLIELRPTSDSGLPSSQW